MMVNRYLHGANKRARKFAKRRLAVAIERRAHLMSLKKTLNQISAELDAGSVSANAAQSYGKSLDKFIIGLLQLSSIDRPGLDRLRVEIIGDIDALQHRLYLLGKSHRENDPTDRGQT